MSRKFNTKKFLKDVTELGTLKTFKNYGRNQK